MKKSIVYILSIICFLFVGSGIVFSNNSNKETTRNLNIFNSVYKALHTNYVDSIDAENSIKAAINAMLYKIDPYTTFYSTDTEYKEDVDEEYAGIGSQHIMRDSNLYITYVVEGFPAQKSGIKIGDQLIAINDTIITKAQLDNISEKIRGEKGTKVKLTVKRPYSTDSIISFDITREIIKPNTVPYYGVIRNDIGYISLTSFKSDSYKKVKEALIELKKDPQVKSIILDLRNNGGGIVTSCIDILSLFLPKNTEILNTRGKDGVLLETYKTQYKPIDAKIPLVILINNYSASASEVVAGSLQDLDRAVIIGSRSFGKGLVQSTIPCTYESYLKVTTAKYYLPSGRLIQAIDYSHRNADGSVARTPDSLTNVYKTSKGREVRDGGGITADITIQPHKYSPLTINAVNEYLIFDYATYFAATNPSIPSPDKFEITDSIFDDFKKFTHTHSFKYDKVCETELNSLRKTAEKEGYMTDSVKAQFDILEKMLRHDLDKDLEKNRQEISQILSQSIVERYYHSTGELINALQFDTHIEEAAKVLHDLQKYNSILNPQNSKK